MKPDSALKFNRADALLLAGMLAAAAALFVAAVFAPKGGSYVRIRTEEGEKRYSLSEDKDISIHTAYGDNVLRIVGGEAYMLSGDCPGGDCLRMGHIDSSGGTIVCLPHHLSISVDGGAVDAVAR